MTFRQYQQVLAGLYLVGCLIYLADFLSLRFVYSELWSSWKIWVVFLCLSDGLTAFGFWKQTSWREKCFIATALGQMAIYLLFKNYFGRNWPLIGFHIVTLATYFWFVSQEPRDPPSSPPPQQ